MHYYRLIFVNKMNDVVNIYIGKALRNPPTCILKSFNRTDNYQKGLSIVETNVKLLKTFMKLLDNSNNKSINGQKLIQIHSQIFK
jgi:hypothetical protein